MRLRIAIVICCTIAGFTAIAFVERRVIPYPDRILEHLPTATLAYAHVSLTPHLRRTGVRWISNAQGWIAAPLADALRRALASRDVRELAFVWFVPEGQSPVLAFVVGQRQSAAPDTIAPATAMIGGQVVRILVVRTAVGRVVRHSLADPRAALAAVRHRPITLLVRPHAIAMRSGSPIAPAASQFPEAIALGGTLDRRGFALRSDGRLPIGRRTRVHLLEPPRADTIQLHRIPVRTVFSAIGTPPAWGSLRAALEPFLPETADILIDTDPAISGAAVRFATPTTTPPMPEVRTLAALVWPTIAPTRLDGLDATVTVVNPQLIDILTRGSGKWEVMRSSGTTPAHDAPLAVVTTAKGTTTITTSRALAARTGDTEPLLWIPARCTAGLPIVALWFLPIHPQAWFSIALDTDDTMVAFCGFPIERYFSFRSAER